MACRLQYDENGNIMNVLLDNGQPSDLFKRIENILLREVRRY